MAKQEAITLDVSSEEIEIYANGDRLIQVLTNLLSNGIKCFTERYPSFIDGWTW